MQELHDGLHDAGWPWTQRHRTRTPGARHGTDVLLATHSFGPAYAAWALGRALGKPWVPWVHGPLQEVLDEARSTPAKRAWLRWLYRRVPRFVFISRHARTSLEGFLGQPLPDARAHVIPNALRLPRAPLRTAPTASGTVELGYVGRLSPEKQPERLIAMLRLLPPRYRLSLRATGFACRAGAAGGRPGAHRAPRVLRRTATRNCPGARLAFDAAGLALRGRLPPECNRIGSGRHSLRRAPRPRCAKPSLPACWLPATARRSLPPPCAAGAGPAPRLQIQRALDSLLARHAVPRFTDHGAGAARGCRMLIHYVRGGNAYLPELAAYADFLQGLGHQAQIHQDSASVPRSRRRLVAVRARVPRHAARRFAHAFQVHEYASASVPPWAWLKDRAKRASQPQPQYRLFQNAWVRARLGFADGVPNEFRDMGIASAFFCPRHTGLAGIRRGLPGRHAAASAFRPNSSRGWNRPVCAPC